MCKEWTKLFNETNLLYLDNHKGVKEKCNENKVGISEIVDSRRNYDEILKIKI